MFDEYPYTDLHNLNLDWFLDQFKKMGKHLADLKKMILSAPDATNATAGQAPIADGAGGWAWGDVQTEVDSALSTTSTNPVQNKVVYEALNEVNGRLASLGTGFDVTWIDGIYISESGAEHSNAAFMSTDYIELSSVLYGIKYVLCLTSAANVVSFYNREKTYISGIRGDGNNTPKTGVVEYQISENETLNPAYIRFSHCKYSAGITNDAPAVSLVDIVSTSKIAAKSVTGENIVDNSISKAKVNFIIHDPNTNYINKSDYSNGYIGASGVFVPNAGWRATGYCELLPNTQYYASGLYGGYCAFYKADKSVIASYGANAFSVSSFVTPDETAFARFSLNTVFQTIENAWVFTNNEKPSDYGYILDGVGVSDSDSLNPCDYTGNDISVFNKILCVGDSMTEGTFNHLDSGSTRWVNYKKYSYPTYLAKMTGVETTNIGHGGQTSVQWYNTEQNTDLSGYDCAIIQLGINDYGTYGELGTDTKTAFQNIINKLKTENNNIKIFVANIIPAISYSSAGYKAYSTALLEWLETEYATDKNVVPVDIQRYGHTGGSTAFNAGHLTALGYRMLARDYIGFISDYIKNNGDVFREVQFIGTDYWYVNPNS